MKTATLNSTLPNKWLLIALLVTVALTLWAFFQVDEPEVELVELADKRAISFASKTNILTQQPIKVNEQAGEIAWEKLKRSPLQGVIHNPFQVHSWLLVPPVKKVKPAPPPPPIAPPAPFTYMGKYEEASASTQIFLLANGKLYSVTQGKNIDSQWRLDGEDINSLHLTYLPLNLPQVLSKATRPTMSATEPASTEMNL